MYVYTCMHMCAWCMYKYMYVYVQVFMSMNVYYNISDSLGRSELGNGRFKFVPILNSIPWRFEDRSMRWSVNHYLFVQ